MLISIRLRAAISRLAKYALAVVVILAIATVVACQASVMSISGQPQLVIDDSLDADFRMLAEETWREFLVAFSARSDCFCDVQLSATRTLDSRAHYDPQSAAVTVRVPGTPAMLKGALIHEWAHHIESQCDAHPSLRADFLAAQGFPAGVSWRPEKSPALLSTLDWSDIPSEHFAEAAIEYVLGRRAIPTKVRVTRESLEIIRRWSQSGDPPKIEAEEGG